MMRYVHWAAVLMVLACTAGAFGSPNPAMAATAAQIDRDATRVLNQLLAATPTAKELAKSARGILVFPSIVKAGFMVGGQMGDGALKVGGKTVGYYRSVAASYGYQVGVQTFGYAMFFMNDEALRYLDNSGGWEIGTGPSIVVVDKGAGGGISTTTGRSDVYAFFFDRKGLMAGLGLQGSKITRINP